MSFVLYSKSEIYEGELKRNTNCGFRGRFDDLKITVVREKAEEYFVSTEGIKIPALRLNIKIEKLLKDFILRGGFDIHEDENA